MVAVTGIGLIACIATGLWAFRPIELQAIPAEWLPQIERETQPIVPNDDSDQIAVYERQLWTPPVLVETEPTTQVAATPPPQPPRLLLIGIVSPSDSASADYEAILYDPDTDTTHIVRTGETVGGLSIGTVTAESAELQTRSGVVELVLDTGRQVGRG